MRNLTLRQLRMVAAVARTGRVQAAAQALGVTPPAITMQLKDLEARVGLPLFERGRNGLTVTPAGQALVDAGGRMEAALSGAVDAVDALKGLSAGVASVAVTRTAKYFAVGILGAFRRRHPGVELRLTVGNRAEVIRMAADLEADVLVMGQPPDGLDVESAVIGDHPFVVAAAPSHRLAGRPLALADLGGEDWLTREPGSGTRDLMARVFLAGGLTPRIGMEVASNETIKQCAMAGLGIAFLSAHTIAAEVQAGRLAVLDVGGLPALRQWRVVRHRDKPPMPAAAALWRFMVREGPAHLPAIAQMDRPGGRG